MANEKESRVQGAGCRVSWRICSANKSAVQHSNIARAKERKRQLGRETLLKRAKKANNL